MPKSKFFLVVTLMCGIGLTACNESSEPPRQEIPESAIKIGDELYVVPVGEQDQDGCWMYRLFSPGKMVAQVIYYQKRDGTFTPDKTQAICQTK